MTELGEIASWIRDSGSVAALTGAGISTESGIPDYRGPQGTWTRDPEAEKLSDIHYYMNYPEIRARAWKARLAHPVWDAKPNAGHQALAVLEENGNLHAIVTQNVDGLHQLAGTSPEILVEIHGTLRDVMCMNCGERAPMHRALDRVRFGEEDPPCRTCGGILKSATISFGQSLIEDDIDRAFRIAASCDVLLAIGTTLVVYPVAHMADIALERGARLVIFNGESTPYDRVAHAVVHAPLGSTLEQLAAVV